MAIEAAGEKLFTLKEVSEQIGVSVTTLKGYLVKKIIKGVKIGGAWHISEKELGRFLREGTERSGDPD